MISERTGGAACLPDDGSWEPAKVLGLAKFYTDCVRVVTVMAHSTSSNDLRTFAEARMNLR